MPSMLGELNNIVHLVEPQDHQSAGIDGDSFHAGRVFAFDIIVCFGDLSSDTVMSVFSGATNGTKTTQESFRYRFSDADLRNANADVYGDWTTVSAGGGLTITAATYNDRIIQIHMRTDELTDGQPWVTLEFTSAASTLFVSAIAVARPRFSANDPLTLLS